MYTLFREQDTKLFYKHVLTRKGLLVYLFFQVSKLPRLPDIHSNGRQERGEIVLNPATLEGGVD